MIYIKASIVLGFYYVYIVTLKQLEGLRSFQFRSDKIRRFLGHILVFNESLNGLRIAQNMSEAKKF